MSDSKLVRVCGLWLNKTKDGRDLIKGSLTPTSDLVILPNKNKQSHKHPDYIMYLAPHEKREEQAPSPQETDHLENIPF